MRCYGEEFGANQRDDFTVCSLRLSKYCYISWRWQVLDLETHTKSKVFQANVFTDLVKSLFKLNHQRTLQV